MAVRASCNAMLLVLCLGPIGAQGQTVQLPTFGSFSVQTTVVVPDRGQLFLGGVSRSRHMTNYHGVPLLSRVPGIGRGFGNRGERVTTESAGLTLTATIHDFEAWDKAVLAEAARRRRAPTSVQRRAKFISEHIVRRSAVTNRGGVAQWPASRGPD